MHISFHFIFDRIMIEVCAVAGHGAVLAALLFSVCFLTENCLDFIYSKLIYRALKGHLGNEISIGILLKLMIGILRILRYKASKIFRIFDANTSI